MSHQLTEDDLKKIKYTNIRNHTGYSLLLGFGSTKQHLKEVIKKGHQGICFTDNGSMMGVLDLYNLSKDKKFLESAGHTDKSFPSILGVAAYITDLSSVKDKENKYYNITLLSKTQKGYENVSYLTSIGYLEEKFYTRPRIDFNDCFKYKQDVICSMGGMNSHIGQAIVDNKMLVKQLVVEQVFEKEKEIISFIDKNTKNPNIVDDFLSKNFVNLVNEEEFVSFKSWISNKENLEAIYNLLKNKELMSFFKNNINKFPVEKSDWEFIHSFELSDEVKSSIFRLFCYNSADNIVKKMKEEFGGDFYLEFHTTDLSKKWIKDEKRFEDIGENPQDRINLEIVRLANKHDVKLILVQDSFIPDKEQHLLQTIMIWNSPGGKDKWYFHEALEIMSVDTMYEKVINLYPWVSDEQFIEWANNSDEILQKCKNINLKFKPSLPKIDYGEHYVNKVPVVIQRKLMLELQDLNLWSEEVKAQIKEEKSIQSLNIPQVIKDKYINPEDIINFEEMKEREQENVFLEDTLNKMKTFYKKDKRFCKILERSATDLAMRTALKVMMRNKKLMPKVVDDEKLAEEIAKKMPGKTVSDFKADVIEKFVEKHQLYKTTPEPMLLLGGKLERERLVEELETIQYNGILRLIGYFMLLEDVSNFIKENGYQRGFGRGCQFFDTLVLTKDSGWKKLGKIKQGEVVYSHSGKERKVIKTFKYDVSDKEKLLEIKLTNGYKKMVLTKDHPMYGVKTELSSSWLNANEKRKKKVRKYSEIKHNPEFIKAEDFKIGDLIFVKTPKYEVTNFKKIDLAKFIKLKNKFEIGKKTITRKKSSHNTIEYSHDRFLEIDSEFAYIIGKWIGDGHLTDNNYIGFDFNSEDKNEVIKVKKYFKNKGFVVISRKDPNKKLVRMIIKSHGMANWFRETFPEYKNTSSTKYIGKFKKLKKELLIELIKGYASADGCVSCYRYVNKKKKLAYERIESLDTTSESLMLDLKEVLFYLGIPHTVTERKPYYRGKYLCSKSYKIRFVGINLDRKKTINLTYPDGFYLKIKSIKEVNPEPVYDLMIEEEPSYLTANGVSHNSGAGSIVAFGLDITDCNPLEYNLLFERFLTKERIGEIYFELDGFPLKDFIKKSDIEISQEDLKLDDEEMVEDFEEQSGDE